MAWISGGTFRMGSDLQYPDEAPAHPITVDSFFIDRTLVTNRDTDATRWHHKTVPPEEASISHQPVARHRS